jgi:hypothetical protein
MMQSSLPWSAERPRVEAVQSVLTLGDDPRYGFVSLLQFATDQPSPLRIAIGFLLATARGMPLDLQAKLVIFSNDGNRADGLIVLWPTSKSTEDLSSALPPKTMEVWKKAGGPKRACLRPVEPTTLRKILAFALWREKAQKQGVTFSPENLKSFIRQYCSEVFPLVIPPAQMKAIAHGD